MLLWVWIFSVYPGGEVIKYLTFSSASCVVHCSLCSFIHGVANGRRAGVVRLNITHVTPNYLYFIWDIFLKILIYIWQSPLRTFAPQSLMSKILNWNPANNVYFSYLSIKHGNWLDYVWSFVSFSSVRRAKLRVLRKFSFLTFLVHFFLWHLLKY